MRTAFGKVGGSRPLSFTFLVAEDGRLGGFRTDNRRRAREEAAKEERLVSNDFGEANFYEVMGLGRAATAQEVQKKYRRLAQERHPDKGGGEEEFKELHR